MDPVDQDPDSDLEHCYNGYVCVQEKPAAGAAVHEGGPAVQPQQGPGPRAGVPEGPRPRVQDTGPRTQDRGKKVRILLYKFCKYFRGVR